MGKLTKNKKSVSDKFDQNKLYTVEEASVLLKKLLPLNSMRLLT